MSTISTMADRRTDAGSSLLTMAAAAASAAKRLWAAYITWRVEQQALGLLNSMSDRQLADMGLSRSELDGIVRGGASLRAPATA